MNIFDINSPLQRIQNFKRTKKANIEFLKYRLKVQRNPFLYPNDTINDCQIITNRYTTFDIWREFILLNKAKKRIKYILENEKR